jgi:hypothetical protein
LQIFKLNLNLTNELKKKHTQIRGAFLIDKIHKLRKFKSPIRPTSIKGEIEEFQSVNGFA